MSAVAVKVVRLFDSHKWFVQDLSYLQLYTVIYRVELFSETFHIRWRWSIWKSPITYYYYLPQTKFAKVMFLQVSVCPHGGGVCMVAPGGHVWLLWGGACVVALEGAVHGCSREVCGCSWGVCMVFWGACMVFSGGHVWFFWGACVVFSGGHVWFFLRGHAWFFLGGGVHRIWRDTVNERAVRILLECILVV